MNQSVVHLGPIEYTQMNESEQILIVNEFRTELTSGEYYTVEVAIESIGVVKVKRKNIGVQLVYRIDKIRESCIRHLVTCH